MLTAADTYVVVLALTAMMADLGIPATHLERAAPVLSGFLIGYVTMLPLLGRLSDRHGRRPVMLGCLAIFAVGSLITASAQDLLGVIVGRTSQGLGGGGLIPVTLAMVADHWPPERRGPPLGAVAAAQEVGSLVGPLYGAALVTWAGWRSIFWINVAIAVALGVGLGVRRPRDRSSSRWRRADPIGRVLLIVSGIAAVVAVTAPPPLTGNDVVGVLFTTVLLGPMTLTVAALSAIGLAAITLVWEISRPAGRALIPIRRSGEELLRGDWLGALLVGVSLGSLVLTFATSDPSREVIADDASLLLPVGLLAAVLFVIHERRHPDPLISLRIFRDRIAAGALLTNLALGGALMAAVIDVPLFARATVYPDSQVQAAMVLVRFLIAVPVGAAIGGWAGQRWGPDLVATAGMVLAAIMFWLMAGWTETTLAEPGLGGLVHGYDAALIAGGVGFGLAIAPVNAAILSRVTSDRHGMATSLVVAARTVGMLGGVSLLTAVGLHRFYAAAASLPSPTQLCPTHPVHCPEFQHLATLAGISELHAIFLGAMGCAGVAAGAALMLRGAPAKRGVAASPG